MVVPSVQTRWSASTIPCIQRHPTWFLSGVTQMSAALATSQLAAIRRLGGDVHVAVSGGQPSPVALVSAQGVQIVQYREGAASRSVIPH